MKCVVFAYHDIGYTAIKTLHEMGQTICAVFTHEDDPKENVWYHSVKELAQNLNIPVFTPENPNTSDWIIKIKAYKPDIIFSFYYRQMICDCILAIAPKGGLNLHGSLLPKYRGRVPVNWAIINGEKETGITLHYMVKKPDAGDIVAQKKIEILEEDTALSVFKKMVPLTREILLETVPLLENGTAPRLPQDHSQATYFGGRKPADGQIDWTQSAKEIYNLVRALTHPYPGAFTFLEGKKVFVWDAKIFQSENIILSPGEKISETPLIIQCGTGCLELKNIQTVL